MKSRDPDSWFSILCLLVVGVLGVGAFFVKPQYEAGVYAIITALLVLLSHLKGSESGGRMPQQAGDAQPGQSSQRETTTRVDTQSPPPAVTT